MNSIGKLKLILIINRIHRLTINCKKAKDIMIDKSKIMKFRYRIRSRLSKIEIFSLYYKPKMKVG